jgi:hypothetical protein
MQIDHRRWGLQDLVASAWHTAEAARTLGHASLEETQRRYSLAAWLAVRGVTHLAASLARTREVV